MTINDPDVVYTDLALAVLGTSLAWRLWRERTELARAGVVIMGALASAAFFGALFHAFFPSDTETRAGFFAWVPVSLSIMLVSCTLLALGLRVLVPALSASVRRLLVAVYCVSFVYAVLFVDESYGTIVRFYAPTLILFLIAAVREAVRQSARAWWLLAAAFALSIVAALLQQLQVALHPVYFDHNALYHVMQGIALVLLYFGFRRASSSARAPGAG
ncbi:MAG TPA: hypothetical protein VH762_15400 [Gemmatimonadaceae bacterium]|jgi:hypothetical protein